MAPALKHFVIETERGRAIRIHLFDNAAAAAELHHELGVRDSGAFVVHVAAATLGDVMVTHANLFEDAEALLASK